MKPLRYVMLGNCNRQARLLWASDDGNDLHGSVAATIEPPFAGSGGGPSSADWRGFVDALVGAWNDNKALRAALADERKVLDLFNAVYEIELAAGEDDAEFLRRGGYEARAVARASFNEWRARRKEQANG